MQAVDRQLVSASEAARMLGISRARVGQLVRENRDFPVSDTYGDVRVWGRSAIEQWALIHPDRGVGYLRPVLGSPGVKAPAVSIIVSAAHQQARSLNHHWVGVEHLLLAMTVPECTGLAPSVLASFGIDVPLARLRLVEAFGDPFELKGGCAVPIRESPRLQFVTERASLKAFELQDEVVDSEHVLLALADAWYDAPLLGRILGERDSMVVVSRVLAISEDTLSQGEGVADRSVSVELVMNPLGFDPWRRRPWTTQYFMDMESGRPCLQRGTACQYLVDRDGYPLMTVNDQFVDLCPESEASMSVSMETPRLKAVSPPAGAGPGRIVHVS